MIENIQLAIDLLDRADANGARVADEIESRGGSVEVNTLEGRSTTTDFVRVEVSGEASDAPVLGVVGQLGGVGARPNEIGIVSDADGAIIAIAAALELCGMAGRGDMLSADIIITTHICPDAPTVAHDPVPLMESPVDLRRLCGMEVSEDMDAVLSVDATKANRVHNQRGIAITPTVKDGWILPVSDDLLDIMERVTGKMPSTLTISMQDLIPYEVGVDHINTILQPAMATDAPLVGLATTSETPVAGSSTGANHQPSLVDASQFIVEMAKMYGGGEIDLYDVATYERLLDLYGDMSRLRTAGDENR